MFCFAMSTKIQSASSCADPFDPATISLADALARIQDRVTQVEGSERLPIRDCLDRINLAAIQSPMDVPASPNSAMDGYAISIDSLPADGVGEFSEIGTAYAGTPFNQTCGKLQCVRIMTGALLPPGTDAVIMQEQAEVTASGRVRIDSDHRVNENIRQAGEDIRTGETLLEAGARISPADLGVLASLGIGELDVVRKPVVAFFSTGDELVSIGEPLAAGKIYDSNRYSLYGMLSRLPVDIIDLGVIRDQAGAIREALLSASQQADLIITTGGVSVGEADYIKPVLEEIGDTEFWKIAIKPGRPLTLGQIDNSIFMGLPGNPVAVMVTFSQFVIPAIQKLAGASVKAPMLFKARALDKMRKRPGRYEFQRGVATLDENNRWQVGKTGKQGSGILTSMSRANCFIVLPDENAGVDIGDEIDIQFFDWSLG